MWLTSGVRTLPVYVSTKPCFIKCVMKHHMKNPSAGPTFSAVTWQQAGTYRAHDGRLPVKHCGESENSVNTRFPVSYVCLTSFRIFLLSSPTGPAEHWAGGSLDRSVSSWTHRTDAEVSKTTSISLSCSQFLFCLFVVKPLPDYWQISILQLLLHHSSHQDGHRISTSSHWTISGQERCHLMGLVLSSCPHTCPFNHKQASAVNQVSTIYWSQTKLQRTR